MRKLVITQNITLDGSIEMLGDWFDPQLQDEDLLAESHRQDAQADALLVGRQTFEDFRGYWPKQSDDATGVTDYLNHVAKYVVSSTMTDPEWQNSTVLAGDPVEQTKNLKSQPGKDIVLTGSISLTHALIAAELVDEYRMFVYPAVQGRGRRLFPDGTAIPKLALVEPPEILRIGDHTASLRPAVNAANRAPAVGDIGRIGGVDIEHPDAEQRWDDDRDETEAQRLDRNWSSLLQELRVAQTGVQLLTGFLLILPFQPRFTSWTASCASSTSSRCPARSGRQCCWSLRSPCIGCCFAGTG